MPVRTPVSMHMENLPNTPLASTLAEFRTWLDSEKIEPVDFKMVVNGLDFGFEISFKNDRDAERFQQRFGRLALSQ